MNELTRQIAIHEGFSSRAYSDTTGHLTIGYGLNLQYGITQKEAQLLLECRIEQCKDELASVPAFKALDEVRQGVLVEMVYNLGMQGLLSFKRMLAALEGHKYILAVSEARDSKWASQIGKDRLNNICFRLLEGRYQN